MRSEAAAAEHGITELSDEHALIGTRLGALQGVLHGNRVHAAQYLHVRSEHPEGRETAQTVQPRQVLRVFLRKSGARPIVVNMLLI